MNEIIKKKDFVIFDKEKWKVILIVIICVLIFVVTLENTSQIWEKNDDEFMNMILAGGYGKEYSVYSVFMNIIFCAFIRFLYSIFPNVNCYFWTFAVLNLCSICIITCIICRKCNCLFSIPVIIFINGLLNYDFYQCFQFTKNAALYSCVSWICLIDYSFLAIESDKKSIYSVFDLICFFIFAFFGYSVRSESFFMVSIYGLLFIFIILMYTKLSLIKKYALLGILLASMLLFGWSVNKYCYSCNGWEYYMDYTKARSAFLDYPHISSSNIDAASFEQYNIHPAEYEIVNHWIHADSERITTMKLNQMRIIGQSEKSLGLRDLKAIALEFIARIRLIYTNHKEVLFSLIFLLIVCLSQRGFTAVFGSLTILGFLYFYLLLNGRLLWRVEWIIWFPIILFILLYISNNTKLRMKDNYRKVVLLILAVISIYSARINYKNNWGKEDYYSSSYCAFLTESSKKESIYYLDVSSFQLDHQCRSIFDLDKKYTNVFHNIHWLGGWMVNTPMEMQNMKTDDLDNPLKDLLYDDRTIFVGKEGRESVVLEYLKAIYNENTKVELIGKTGEYCLWEFYSK